MGNHVERVFQKNSVKPNAASHNNTSWHTDTDGFLTHSPIGRSLYYKGPALQKTILVLGGVPPWKVTLPSYLAHGIKSQQCEVDTQFGTTFPNATDIIWAYPGDQGHPAGEFPFHLHRELQSLENSMEPLRTSFQGHECVVVKSQCSTVCTISGLPVLTASCKTAHSSQFTFVTSALCWSETLADSKYPKEISRCNKVWPCVSSKSLQSQGAFTYDSSHLCRVWLKEMYDTPLHFTKDMDDLCGSTLIFSSIQGFKDTSLFLLHLNLIPFLPSSAKVKERLCTGSILD